jgi:hypothetical protein
VGVRDAQRLALRPLLDFLVEGSREAAPLFDQAHRLKLELPRKLTPLHDPPPAPSKHLTRCLRNRVQANYATRRPEELGKFNWVIDAKGNMEKPNEWEEWWSSFILPVLQSHSFTRPFRQLPAGVGDYSHLARFETGVDAFIQNVGNWTSSVVASRPRCLRLGMSEFSQRGNERRHRELNTITGRFC